MEIASIPVNDLPKSQLQEEADSLNGWLAEHEGEVIPDELYNRLRAVEGELSFRDIFERPELDEDSEEELEPEARACNDCGGSGDHPSDPNKVCGSCGGRGYVPAEPNY